MQLYNSSLPKHFTINAARRRPPVYGLSRGAGGAPGDEPAPLYWVWYTGVFLRDALKEWLWCWGSNCMCVLVQYSLIHSTKSLSLKTQKHTTITSYPMWIFLTTNPMCNVSPPPTQAMTTRSIRQQLVAMIASQELLCDEHGQTGGWLWKVDGQTDCLASNVSPSEVSRGPGSDGTAIYTPKGTHLSVGVVGSYVNMAAAIAIPYLDGLSRSQGQSRSLARKCCCCVLEGNCPIVIMISTLLLPRLLDNTSFKA